MSDMSKEEAIKIMQTEQAYANERYATDTYRYYRVDKAYSKAIETLENQKTGHWRHYEGMLICSECKTEFYDDIMEYCGDDVPKYCLNCGAKMEIKNGN